MISAILLGLGSALPLLADDNQNQSDIPNPDRDLTTGQYRSGFEPLPVDRDLIEALETELGSDIGQERLMDNMRNRLLEGESTTDIETALRVVTDAIEDPYRFLSTDTFAAYLNEQFGEQVGGNPEFGSRLTEYWFKSLLDVHASAPEIYDDLHDSSTVNFVIEIQVAYSDGTVADYTVANYNSRVMADQDTYASILTDAAHIRIKEIKFTGSYNPASDSQQNRYHDMNVNLAIDYDVSNPFSAVITTKNAQSNTEYWIRSSQGSTITGARDHRNREDLEFDQLAFYRDLQVIERGY